MEFDLMRFTDAQKNEYQDALAELQAGCKRGHWMWFVFPQLRGLGHSESSRFYGIANATEASEYLQHPVLGYRLVECTNAVLQLENASLLEIFCYPDNLKFISSMTLFDIISRDHNVFAKALAKFNQEKRDQKTIKLLN